MLLFLLIPFINQGMDTHKIYTDLQQNYMKLMRSLRSIEQGSLTVSEETLRSIIGLQEANQYQLEYLRGLYDTLGNKLVPTAKAARHVAKQIGSKYIDQYMLQNNHVPPHDLPSDIFTVDAITFLAQFERKLEIAIKVEDLLRQKTGR